MPAKHKQVKLQPRYRALTRGRKMVPELKISGLWLEAMGFKAGETVMITVEEELLVIQPVKTL